MVEPQYSISTAKSALRNVSDSLAPFRPPTAPESDIEQEKKKIVKGGGPNFLFIQTTVFVFALSILCYIVLPFEYANPIAFLLLSVGVAVGIFLWKG